MASLTTVPASQRALTQNCDKLYALPYDCRANISSFLTFGGVARLTTVCKKDFAKGAVDVQTRELFLKLVLENPESSGQALLRAIDQDKVEIVSALLARGSGISAEVGVVAMQKIQEKQEKSGPRKRGYYDMFVTFPPRYQVLRADQLRDEVDVMRFLKPLLSMTPAIPPDWLGQALIQVAKSDDKDSVTTETKKVIIDLILNHSDISSNDVLDAFLAIARIQSPLRSIVDETLMLFLKKEMTFSQKNTCLFWAARYGYRRAVASLIKSLAYEIDSCRVAFRNAAGHGHREIVQDFLADQLRMNIDSAIIGGALVDAAKGCSRWGDWGNIVRDLLASTPTLNRVQVTAALNAANAKKATWPSLHTDFIDEIIELLENYLSLHADESET